MTRRVGDSPARRVMNRRAVFFLLGSSKSNTGAGVVDGQGAPWLVVCIFRTFSMFLFVDVNLIENMVKPVEILLLCFNFCDYEPA